MKRIICFAMILTLLLGIIGCDIKEKPQSGQEALESVITEELINPSIENPENSPEIEINENKNPNSQQQTQVQNQKPSEPEIKTPKKQEKPLINKVYKNLEFYAEENLLAGFNNPSYMVTSKKGCSKASMDIDLSAVQANLMGNKEKHEYLIPYILLRYNTYDLGGDIIDMANIGLAYNTGGDGKWHFVYKKFLSNYNPVNYPQDENFGEDNENNTSDDRYSEYYSWAKSSVNIDPKGKYRITVDGSQKDGYCTASILDVNTGKVIDKIEIEVFYSVKSGNNTSISQLYYTEFSSGLYNVQIQNENYFGEHNYNQFYFGAGIVENNHVIRSLYINNINISNIKLFRNGQETAWTEDLNSNSGMWPSKDDNVTRNIITVNSNKSGQEVIINVNLKK